MNRRPSASARRSARCAATGAASWFCWAVPCSSPGRAAGRKIRPAPRERARTRGARTRHAGPRLCAGTSDRGRPRGPRHGRVRRRPRRRCRHHRQHRDGRRPLDRDRRAGPVPRTRPAPRHLLDPHRSTGLRAPATGRDRAAARSVCLARFHDAGGDRRGRHHHRRRDARHRRRPHGGLHRGETGAGAEPADQRSQLSQLHGDDAGRHDGSDAAAGRSRDERSVLHRAARPGRTTSWSTASTTTTRPSAPCARRSARRPSGSSRCSRTPTPPSSARPRAEW